MRQYPEKNRFLCLCVCLVLVALLYRVEDGRIGVICADGEGQHAAKAESGENLEKKRGTQQAGALASTQEDFVGWTAEETVFGGLSFAQATPEQIIEMLGIPHTDEETQEITYTLRQLLYPNVLFEFVWDEQAWRLEAARVSGGGLEGPKNLRVGDTRDSVLQRFGEGNDDDESLLYTTVDAQGDAYALSCYFYDNVLTGYLLYRIL